jgi:hypothetical protein
MRIVLLDLPADFDQEALTEALSHHAPVQAIDVIRDGNPDQPMVLVSFTADSSRLSEIALQLGNRALLGHPVRAHVMMHE